MTGAFSLDNGANGMAFNPVPDRIRIVSTANGNKRINPNDGTLAATDTTLAYVAGDVNAGQVPGVSTIAYTNHYLGATTTTVYAIDSGVAALARLGSANGSPLSPNSGQLTTIASLGFPPSSSLGGMTIQPGTNTAYAAIQVAGVSTLYMVHLNTGATTLIGAIGSGTAIGGIAIAPASPCLDIDGDGRIDALSDGLVLLRALFGLSGAAATNAAVPATSPRSDWPAIRNHLNANCGLHLAP